MTVASKTAGLTKAINDTVKELQVTQASLDGQVTTAEAYATTAATHQTTAEGYRDTTATHAATVATDLATVDTNVTYSGIAAIAASKVETAVDVFVYDTSLDSDGGAWRKRCQHTSWYNETLNTATRGSRREFPSVAVIVAEANTLTIYDGDDPSLPMWMVFNGYTGWNRIITYGDSGRISSVAMLNGILTVTTNEATNNTSVNGPFAVSFVDDSAHKFNAAHGHRVWPQDIARRNSSVAPGWLNVVAIGSGVVAVQSNDVAMTVLPDAPIDPATGLPVPTIAVATAGGVSVIKDDGTVSNVTNYVQAALSVDFAGESLWVTGRYQDWAVQLEREIWETNYTLGTLDHSWKGTGGPNPLLGISGTHLAHGGNAGFVQLHRAIGVPTLINANRHDHVTGWMPGDIKGAFLSDTDNTDLVASGELVTNGTFDTDTSGWTAWCNSGLTPLPTLSVSSGQMVITANVHLAYQGAYQTFTTEIGRTYTLTLDVKQRTSSNSWIRLGTAVNNSSYANISSTVADGKTVTFTATGTSATLSLLVWATGDTLTVDNVSVKLADADRSVNNKGLIVNGTVTRSPVATGAELVGYSGFSTTNYLEQPYNSALDFGTGDFSVMGWHKKPGINVTGGLIKRLDAADSGAGFNVYHFGHFNTTVKLFNGVGGSKTITATLKDGWQHVCVVRKGDVLSLYSDGVLAASVTGVAAYDLSNVNGILKIGSDGTGSVMALWRISATAPTDDQIKKIYEDERKLFQPGAQCTLYGTSDAVTALAHDPKTNLLHVGTSAGRSTFDGLVRVDNTTNPVGTAISAVNGLIVEE